MLSHVANDLPLAHRQTKTASKTPLCSALRVVNSDHPRHQSEWSRAVNGHQRQDVGRVSEETVATVKRCSR